MRSFYLTYEIVQRPIGQLEIPPNFCLNIPWGHSISLMEKVKNLEEREWYAKAAIEHGWSRPMLELWIENEIMHSVVLTFGCTIQIVLKFRACSSYQIRYGKSCRADRIRSPV